MFEELLVCLDAIGTLEDNWDAKTVAGASGFVKKITDPNFIVCIQTIHLTGYTKGLRVNLQGRHLIVSGVILWWIMYILLYPGSVENRHSGAMFLQTLHINISKGQSSYHSWTHCLWKWTCHEHDMSMHSIQGLQLVPSVTTQKPVGHKQETV